MGTQYGFVGTCTRYVSRTISVLCPLFIFTLFFHAEASASCEDPYPKSWWAEITRDANVPDWEILPQDATCPELILSKRNPDLALLSNFAATPFELDGVRYASVEGFWQMMKYPDPEIPNDPRTKSHSWTSMREKVSQLTGFDAKHAGNEANTILDRLGISWWSYRGHRFEAKGKDQAYHLDLITRAIVAKLAQNSNAARVLERSSGLTLRPDHHQAEDSPQAWRYTEILMRLRDQ